MEVILLERVAKLGQMGDTVRVRDGFARNFLLPRGKALRATKANKERFENAARASSRRAISSAASEAEAVAAQARRAELRDHPPGRRDRRALRLGLDPRPRRARSPAAASRSTATRSSLNAPIKTLGLHTVPVVAASRRSRSG